MHKVAPGETFSRFFKHFHGIFEHYNIVHDNNNPEFMFFSNTPPKTSARRIFYTNEPYGPIITNPRQWSFSTQPDWKISNPRHMRQPFYVRLGGGPDLVKPEQIDAEAILSSKTKFCNFIYNHSVPVRNNFFSVLNKYKPIDSPGASLQNCPPIGNYSSAHESRFTSTCVFQEKMDFITPYKFTIAFENSLFDGYTSEKIYQGMLANSIPIFWGNKYISEDFNTRSFISAHDREFSSEKEMLEYLVNRVIELDTNDDLYLEMLRQPWLTGNVITPTQDQKLIVNRFRAIFDS